MTTFTFPLPADAITRFCWRWKIRELALFGSVLRTDFRPDSDVDVLVTFTDDAHWGLLAHVQMQQELATILQRPVDLISQTRPGTESQLDATGCYPEDSPGARPN
jgi:uncharacterized protein